jgi:hypothetical protein
MRASSLGRRDLSQSTPEFRKCSPLHQNKGPLKERSQ